jgi:hypothetical protein
VSCDNITLTFFKARALLSVSDSNITYLVVDFNKFRIISFRMTTLQTLSAKSLSVPTQNIGIISAIYQHFPKIINVYFGA